MRAIILFVIAITLLGCGSEKKEPYQELSLSDKAVAVLVSRLDDPDSFELVHVELVDSATVGKNMHAFRIAEGDPSVFKGTSLYAQKVETIRRLDSIENSLRGRCCLDSIVSYSYFIEYRAKNAFGAKVLSSVIIQISPAGDVLKIASDVGNLLLYPGGFPGCEILR